MERHGGDGNDWMERTKPVSQSRLPVTQLIKNINNKKMDTRYWNRVIELYLIGRNAPGLRLGSGVMGEGG